MFINLRLTLGSALAAFLVPVATFAASGDMMNNTATGSTATGGTLMVVPTSTGSEVTDDTEEDTRELIMIEEADAIDLPALPAVADDAALTRAQLTARVVQMLYTDAEIDHCFWDIASTLPPTFTLVYTDVPVTSPYAKYICIAMRDGIVNGFKDGSFLPNRTVNLAEAGTIISRAFAFAPFAHTHAGVWYWPHMESLSVRNVIPYSLSTLNDTVTEQDLEEMMMRIQDGVTWLPSRTLSELIPRPVPPAVPPSASSSATTNVSSPAVSSSARSSSSSAAKEDSTVSPSSESPDEDEDKAWWNPF